MKKDLSKKLYYTLREASELLGVKYHILRYWDKEFKVRKRGDNKKKSLKYRRDDIEKFLKIKNYLYNELYTITGVKRKLLDEKKRLPDKKNIDYRSLILRLKRGLRSIEAMLD